MKNLQHPLALSLESIQEINDHIAKINFIIESFETMKSKNEYDIAYRIDLKNIEFTESVMRVLKENKDLIPPVISGENMLVDYTAFRQLENSMKQLNAASKKIGDFNVIIGNDVLQNAMAVFTLFKAAAQSGLEGTEKVFERLEAEYFMIERTEYF